MKGILIIFTVTLGFEFVISNIRKTTKLWSYKGNEGPTILSGEKASANDIGVPFSLENKNEFTPEQMKNITWAIGQIEKHTCIRFLDAKSDNIKSCVANGKLCFDSYGTPVVRLQKGLKGGKCSYYGTGRVKRHSYQDLTITPFCMEKPGMVIHELMHALGFEHEHQRPDRDDFVEVTGTSCYNSDFGPSYEKMDQDKFDDKVDYGYDYCSIMHYGFGKKKGHGDSCYLKLKKGAKVDCFVYDDEGKKIHVKSAKDVGQRFFMSENDKKMINEKYGCPK